jgi:hypothetical protein
LACPNPRTLRILWRFAKRKKTGGNAKAKSHRQKENYFAGAALGREDGKEESRIMHARSRNFAVKPASAKAGFLLAEMAVFFKKQLTGRTNRDFLREH